MLGNPHLVLADVAGHDQPVAARFGQLLEQRGRDRRRRPARRSVRRTAASSPGNVSLPRGRCSAAAPVPATVRPVCRSMPTSALRSLPISAASISRCSTFALGANVVQLAGGPVVEARAEHDQQIAFLHRVVGGRIAVHAQHAQVEADASGSTAPRPFQRVHRREAGRAHQRAGEAPALAHVTPPPTYSSGRSACA